MEYSSPSGLEAVTQIPGSSPAKETANDTGVPSTGPIEDSPAEDGLHAALTRQKQAFDLAMTAAQMGTWRYTLADNICRYDENAQRLYGLTEPCFLHDEEGVKWKIHPDDLELMWSRVAAALEPEGDGRYKVEYRVRQLDGSWRWLSAWGLVEYDGEGPSRKAVAIVGASRDLTDRRQAEDLQRLLLNELNHRVKNTLATIQSICWQTLKAATDLPSAQEALDRRLCAMAQAHDLLTARNWTGANLTDIVARAVEAFTPDQLTASGPPVEISPKHTLALSLALHELATNATKYGALSCPDGHVSLRWSVADELLSLEWEERDGPPVVAPTRKGFGSRLLERVLGSDLSGRIKLSYRPSGLRCSITARL